MQRLRKMKGFTLIELIVVVIIIGILAAVSAIAYNKFVGDARVNAVKADAKNAAQKINSNAVQDTPTGFANTLVTNAATFNTTTTGLPATKLVNSTDGTKHYVVDTNVTSGTPATLQTKVWCEVLTSGESASVGECVTVKPAGI